MRKMSGIRLGNRGQISAEYLLIFVVILTVFFFMISNFIGPTIDASNNVSAVSDTKIVVDDIANAVNIVYANGPGAKRTVNINVPHDMTLTFANQTVGVNVDNLNYTQNGNFTTSKSVLAPIDYTGTIDPVTLTKGVNGWRTVQIYWNTSISPAKMEVTQIS